MPLSSATAPHSASSAEIMLFGVRVVVDSMRKSVSMNNLSQYDHHRDTAAAAKDDAAAAKDDAAAAAAAGYASADDAAPNNSGKNRDRKRGIPWTEEEHKLFLVGLQKVGKGDWRGISRNYVKTRTPTQVASHAQKYFLRRTNFNRRRRRSSLFDITTDSVSSVQVSTTPMEEGEIQHEDNVSLVHPMYPVTGEGSNINGFSMLPMYSKDIAEAGNPMKILTLGQGNNVEQNGPCTKLVCTTPPIVPASDITATSLSSVDPPTLSLGLSLSSTQRQTSSIHSAFHSLSRFNNGDSVITVA